LLLLLLLLLCAGAGCGPGQRQEALDAATSRCGLLLLAGRAAASLALRSACLALR
jgi:hypothetical protein